MPRASDIAQQIESTAVVAIIRAASSGELVDVVSALRDGGLSCIEVTMTTPHALDVVSQARAAVGDSAVIGVGSVLDAETARAAILAGAQFVVAPIVDLPTIEMCRRYSVPVLPGALTPTEIVGAWQAGADFVKVFPATTGGPGLIRDLKGPLPHIKFVPTGGVKLDNLAEFLHAGASAVGVGSALVTKEALKNKDYAGLKATAAQWLQRARQARETTR